MLAAFLKVPGLAITEDESKKLAAAITRVTDLYDVPMLDEKTRAWINLTLVGVEVYGTRAATVLVERKRGGRILATSINGKGTTAEQQEHQEEDGGYNVQ